MNIIAPVFAPGAQTSPAVEDALRALWMKEAPAPRQFELFTEGHFSGKVAPEIVERRRKVHQLHDEGLSPKQIADQIGVGRDRVWADQFVMGLKSNPEPDSPEETARKRRAQVKRLMSRYGMTAREIADSLNANISTIRRDMRAINGGKP